MTDTRELVTKLRGICVTDIRENYEVLGEFPLVTADEAIWEAADLITAQAEENQRLREAIRQADDILEDRGFPIETGARRVLRIALSSTGEKG
ncbi:hypothetical protein LO749_16765 [Paracoccus denitrificans]|uniref:hypothetical protein n=1 Tax=Paracoccus denitrificans TaxID=266 RepID=UPI001E51ADE8|nr:hypothetical protein [Paracoccus denitrificans]UFS67743.1 hypothetical protein LO749_16765 [Paracoccus denitrificans]